MNPILAANDTWKCPGHGSIVQDPEGKYFLLYHAYGVSNSIYTGRQGILDEVTFGADDWPVINHGKGPSIRAVSPLGTIQKITDGGFADDFHGKNLDSGWEWPQQLEPKYRFANGALYLSPNGPQTNVVAAVMARSTTAADYVATTAIAANALKPGVTAGISAFGSLENALGVALQDVKVVVWRRDHGQTRELWTGPSPKTEKIFLRLTAANGYHFQFAASQDGENWSSCGEAVDAKKLPPWDLGVRVALTVGGGAGAEGVFDSFSMISLKNP